MDVTTVYIAVMLLVMGVKKAEPSDDVMKYINSEFVKVMEECKHELQLPENFWADLYHFWKLEYNLLNRETGCIIICMSKKLELVDDSGNLMHGHAQQFAVEHGAGEELASQLVSSLHNCEKKNEGIEDECARVLEIAKCFRTDVHELDWSPKVQYIVEEVLTEI